MVLCIHMPVAQIVLLEAFVLVRILVRWSLGVFFAKTLNTPTCNTRSWVTMLHLRHKGGPITVCISQDMAVYGGAWQVYDSVCWGMTSAWQCTYDVGANGGWANYAS